MFQSCRDGATASWVINQYFRGVKCLAQGHNTAAVGFEPPTSRSGVRHSTTEPPRSPASSEFGTYRLCEQRRFKRACASAQARQNLRYSLIQAVSHEEPSDRKPDLWPLWMAGHAQSKFVMTECSKTQIRLTGLIRKAHFSKGQIVYHCNSKMWKRLINWEYLRILIQLNVTCISIFRFVELQLKSFVFLWHFNTAPCTNEPRHEKTCLCHMRTTKTQISLSIRAVWSAPLLFAA